MDGQVTKASVLDAIQKGRTEWDALLAEVGEERMTLPGPDGWSVKDVIAHNTWNEREMVRLLGDHVLNPSDSDRLWEMTTDQRNEEIYKMYRDKPLDEALAEDRRVHEQLVQAMEHMEDADMTDPARFPGMPPDWEPWRIIAGCTFNHYPEHIEPIRAWLESFDKPQRVNEFLK